MSFLHQNGSKNDPFLSIVEEVSVWFPHRLGKWENNFQSGKSGNFEHISKSGIFEQNIGKVREFYRYILLMFL